METSDASQPITLNCPTCNDEVRSDLLIPAGDSKICPSCKDDYAQRLKEGASTAGADDYEEIRQEHIKHEASIRSVGILYYLGGGFMIIAAISSFFLLSSTHAGSAAETTTGLMIGVALVYIVLGVISFFLGTGFRKLKSWVRVPGTIFATLGLLSFPIGTLINGYILYLIWAKKGKMVFSPEYKDIVEATPHIKYRTSPLVWIFLIIIVIGLLAAIGIGASGN